MHAIRADEQVAVIDRFGGEFGWLANQSLHRSGYGGHFYRTVEHAYAAAKSDDDADRSAIAALPTPAEAYQAGRRVPLRADWDKRIRFEAMWAALSEKFADPELAVRLRDTGDALLVDGTVNHDQHWSECHCPRHFEYPGANHLGRALMALRSVRRDDPPDRWPRAAIVGTRELLPTQSEWLVAELPRVLRKLAQEHGTSTLISGMAVGAGVEGAEIAGSGGYLQLWAYLPYPDQTAAWPAAWVHRQQAARMRATRTVILGDKPVGGNHKRGLRLDYDRHRLMVRDASVLIAVHDRNAAGQTGSVIALAEEIGVSVVTMDPVGRTVAIAKR